MTARAVPRALRVPLVDGMHDGAVTAPLVPPLPVRVAVADTRGGPLDVVRVTAMTTERTPPGHSAYRLFIGATSAKPYYVAESSRRSTA